MNCTQDYMSTNDLFEKPYEHEELTKAKQTYEQAEKDLDFAIRINDMVKNHAGSWSDISLVIGISDSLGLDEKITLRMIDKGCSVMTIVRTLNIIS